MRHAGSHFNSQRIPPIAIRTTRTYFSKSVEITTTNPPLNKCAQGYLEIIANIGRPFQYLYQRIPYVSLPNCGCFPQDFRKLLIFSSGPFALSSAGALHLTKDINIVVLPINGPIPKCNQPPDVVPAPSPPKLIQHYLKSSTDSYFTQPPLPSLPQYSPVLTYIPPPPPPLPDYRNNYLTPPVYITPPSYFFPKSSHAPHLSTIYASPSTYKPALMSSPSIAPTLPPIPAHVPVTSLPMLTHEPIPKSFPQESSESAPFETPIFLEEDTSSKEDLLNETLSNVDEDLSLVSLPEEDEDLSLESLPEEDEDLSLESVPEEDEDLSLVSLPEEDENLSLVSLPDEDEDLSLVSLPEEDKNLSPAFFEDDSPTPELTTVINLPLKNSIYDESLVIGGTERLHNISVTAAPIKIHPPDVTKGIIDQSSFDIRDPHPLFPVVSDQMSFTPCISVEIPTCPQSGDEIQKDFSDLYCYSRFAYIVAVGFNASHLSKDEDGGELRFLTSVDPETPFTGID
ncbi:hypothetical protein NPIL_236941, partial [Nephila pilipes]